MGSPGSHQCLAEIKAQRVPSRTAECRLRGADPIEPVVTKERRIVQRFIDERRDPTPGEREGVTAVEIDAARAVHLPQLEAVVKPSVSGVLVDRQIVAARLADAFVGIRDGIANGDYAPERVASVIGDYAADVQIARIYQRHRDLLAARALV